MLPASVWLLAGWITLHVIAFALACGTRIAAGSSIERLAQRSFYVALTLVGMVMLIGRQVDVSWVWSAVTFMAMVITAVLDFQHVSETATVGIRH